MKKIDVEIKRKVFEINKREIFSVNILVFLVNAYNVSVKVHKFGLGDCEYSFIVAASLINQFF